MVGHVSPEAARGGPIALLVAGDVVEIDVEAGGLSVALEDPELERRQQALAPPAPRFSRGVFARYAASVSSASQGAVLSVAVSEDVSASA
jgi:dihydroxy-acid dehydratase